MEVNHKYQKVFDIIQFKHFIDGQIKIDNREAFKAVNFFDRC